jgi:phospholipase/carboxylesterase
MTYQFTEQAGAAGAPLLFVFHGTGGNEAQLVPLAKDVMPDAHIISSRGDVSENGALRFFRRKAEGVYDMGDLARATEKMQAFVASHVERLKPTRVIGLGYSNGANILASVMFRPDQLFHQAVLMHPLIPFEPTDNPALKSARILITAGKRDPICPPQLTEALESYFKRQSADTLLHWHDGGHELRQTEIDAARDFLKG